MKDVTLCSATLGEDGKKEPPLGPLYIASAFRSEGVEVDFRDFQLEPGANGLSGDVLKDFLMGHREHLAISCLVDMLPAVIAATESLKNASPDTKILLGGPGPTALARELLEAYPWIDAVAGSEGEEIVIDWVRLQKGKIKSGTPIAGLTYRESDGIVGSLPRNRIKQIDEIPLPSYDLIPWDQYSSARVITTRGCSYACSFCDVTMLWGRQSVFRSVSKVVDEMLLLRDQYGQRSIGIVDDTFVLNRKRVIEFCKELIARKAGIKWGCFGRINLMSEDLVSLMAEAGCSAIFYGIDSGSQEVLDTTVKRVSKDDIIPVLDLSSRYFEHIEASFIWGYPFETLNQFKETLDLAAAASDFAPRVNVQMHMLSPLPSASLTRKFREHLVPPERADLPWLLLPPLLLDSPGNKLRSLILKHPEIYPGFLTFATPDKLQKRELLYEAMRELHKMIGLTFTDESVAKLAEVGDSSLESSLMSAVTEPTQKIGRGLAIGYFRRIRSTTNPTLGTAPTDGSRGPSFVRESNNKELIK